MIIRKIGEEIRGFGQVNLANSVSAINNNGLLVGLINLGFLLVLMNSVDIVLQDQIMILVSIAGVVLMALMLFVMVEENKAEANQSENENGVEAGSSRKNLILNESWPLLVAGLATFVMTTGDIWFVKSAEGAEVAAIYGTTARLAGGIAVLLLAINSVVSPMVAAKHLKGDIRTVETTIARYSLFAFSVGVCIYILFFLYGKAILATFYGDYYVGGYYYLLILSLGYLVSVFCGPAATTLTMVGGQKLLMCANLLGACVFVIVGYFFSAILGGTGIAIAASACWAGVNLINVFLVKKKTGMLTIARW